MCIMLKRIYFMIFFRFFFLFCGRIVQVQSTITFSEDFETQSLNDNFRTHIQPEGGTYIQDFIETPEREGYSIHFKCTNCKRNEITQNGGMVFIWGEEYWVAFSVRIVEYLGGTTNWGLITQHHSVPANEDWGNCVSGPNTFAVYQQNGGIKITGTKNPSLVDVTPSSGSAGWGVGEYWSEPAAKLDFWYDFVIHFRLATDSTGYFEGWLNGNKIFTHNGVTAYKRDLCGLVKEPWSYHKAGLYLGGGDGEILYDNVKVGDSDCTLSDFLLDSGGCDPECNSHQTCNTADQCECLSGWGGTGCDNPICDSDCLKNQICTSPNTCWITEDCDVRDCNGTFAGIDCTECLFGWKGDNCDKKVYTNEETLKITLGIAIPSVTCILCIVVLVTIIVFVSFIKRKKKEGKYNIVKSEIEIPQGLSTSEVGEGFTQSKTAQ